MADTITSSCILTALWGGGGLVTVDSATGIVFADTEKARGTGDLQCCWLATASNIMYWGGWVTAGDGTISGEDKFMDYALSCWDDQAGLEANAFSWWLNGSAMLYDITVPGGGGKLPRLDPETYCTVKTASQADLKTQICLYLDAGYGVSLGISNGGFSHAVTCWGYEFDGEDLYFYYSDSDDNRASTSDRSAAVNTLYRAKAVCDDDSGVFSLDYWFADGTYITDFTAIIQYDPIFSGIDETVSDRRALELASGVSVRRGRFDVGGYDNDYYSVTVDGTLALTAAYLSGSGADFSLSLLDSAGITVAEWAGSDVLFNLSGLSGLYYLRFGADGVASSNVLDGVYSFSFSSDHRAVRWADGNGMAAAVSAAGDTVYAADIGGCSDGSGGFAAVFDLSAVSRRNIFGGASAMEVAGDCRTLVLDGSVATVCGGGDSGCAVGGDIELVLENVSVKSQLLGGGRSAVEGVVRLTVSNCGGTCNFFGGASGAFVAGTITAVYSGGRFTGLIFGGSRASGGSGGSGDVYLSVSGLTQLNNVKLLASGSTAWLVGGGQVLGGGALNCADVSITVSGGSHLRYIVGGAQAEGEGSAATVGSVSITIASSELDGNVYGGGYAMASGVSRVAGGVSITVDSTGITSIYGNIYGGGTAPRSGGGIAAVEGGTTVTFTGLGDCLNFSGMVSGDGAVSGTVIGEKSLIFDKFCGAFSASVRNFDTLRITDSTVAMSAAVGMERAVFRITEAVSGVMLTAASAAFERLDIELDTSLLSSGCEFMLLECGDWGNFDDSIAVCIYDAAGGIIGSMSELRCGDCVEVAGGFLRMGIEDNTLLLEFLA